MTLLIATPVRASEMMSASVSVGYSESVRALARELPIDTIDAALMFSTDIVRARNRAAAIALREWPKMSHVLWWDDDQWPEDRTIVSEMLATGADVIGAPYTNKKLPLKWVHQELSGQEPSGGLLEVRYLGFGFTMTSRACLERMMLAARIYTDHPHERRVGNMFGQLYESPEGSTDPADDGLLSEDYSFCKRWREMGGRVMLYCRAGLLMHAGAHAWSAAEMPGGVVSR